MPTCEVRLNQILAKNPRPIYRFNRLSCNPYTGKFTNQEIILANERS